MSRRRNRMHQFGILTALAFLFLSDASNSSPQDAWARIPAANTRVRDELSEHWLRVNESLVRRWIDNPNRSRDERKAALLEMMSLPKTVGDLRDESDRKQGD